MLSAKFKPALLGVALPLLSTITALAPLALVALLEVRAAEVPRTQEKAANVARMKAETKYRTAACMHQLGGGSCMVRASSDGYRFQFLGGTPGWETMNRKPTVETQIMVSPDGTRVENVIYNGAPR